MKKDNKLRINIPGNETEMDVKTFRKHLEKMNAGPYQVNDGTRSVMAPRTDDIKMVAKTHPDEGFFIPFNVPSKKRAYKPIWVSKNTPKSFIRDCTGPEYLAATKGHNKRMGMAKQDHVIEYEEKSAPYWAKFAPIFRELIGVERPVYVQMFFMRSTNATRWDFNNLSQMVCDMMVTHGWIDDDNIDNLVAVPPFDKPKWIKDSHAPGVLIKVLNIEMIDKYKMKAIKECEEKMSDLIHFVSTNHPNIVSIAGKDCIDITIDILKKLWNIN